MTIKLVVSLLALAFLFGARVQDLEAQNPPYLSFWVDSINGDDTGAHDGSATEPYLTITHAVSVANSSIGSGWANIYVRGLLSGGSVVTYNDVSSNPNKETFPLTPKKNVSILRDTVGSDTGAPAIIESVNGATLIKLGTQGLAYTADSKFQSLTFRGGDPAVYIYSKSNWQTLKPVFHACTFVDNEIGIHGSAGLGGTLNNTEVSPTIRFSTFTTSGDLTSDLAAHVYLYAKGSSSLSNNRANGSLHMNSLTADPDDVSSGRTIQHGVRLRASNHATVGPKLTGNTIDGNATATGDGGIVNGLRAESTSNSSIPFELKSGTVTECVEDGIFLKSTGDATPPPLQPTVSGNTISGNGFGPATVHYLANSGITIYGGPSARFYPTVSDNTITGNRNHGVAVSSTCLTVGCTSTVAPTIASNTITQNGSNIPSGGLTGCGILLNSMEGTVEGRVERNRIEDNARHGISIVAQEYFGYNTPKIATEVVGNLVRGHTDSNVVGQGTGINMDTVGTFTSQIWPKIVHNTVVGNYHGTINRDAPSVFHEGGLRIYNTIMWDNTVTDLGDMHPTSQQVFYSNWENGHNDNHPSNKKGTDPEFSGDPEFHLSTNSNLIDSATEFPPVSPISLDWDGENRTINYVGAKTDEDNDMGIDEVSG